jgi:hypothetical protein
MSACYPRKADNMAFRVLQGEAILMNPVDSSLYNLNEVATAIWQAADGHTSLAQIVEREICPRFEIDSASALCDAEEFVESLAEHSVLLLSHEPFDE